MSHELQPLPHLTDSSAQEMGSPTGKGADKTAATTQVVDPEAGEVDDKQPRDDERYDMVIPQGVDPSLMPHETVKRGLKQRHIQVGPSSLLGLLLRTSYGGCLADLTR